MAYTKFDLLLNLYMAKGAEARAVALIELDFTWIFPLGLYGKLQRLTKQNKIIIFVLVKKKNLEKNVSPYSFIFLLFLNETGVGRKMGITLMQLLPCF